MNSNIFTEFMICKGISFFPLIVFDDNRSLSSKFSSVEDTLKKWSYVVNT